MTDTRVVREDFPNRIQAMLGFLVCPDEVRKPADPWIFADEITDANQFLGPFGYVIDRTDTMVHATSTVAGKNLVIQEQIRGAMQNAGLLDEKPAPRPLSFPLAKVLAGAGAVAVVGIAFAVNPAAGIAVAGLAAKAAL